MKTTIILAPSFDLAQNVRATATVEAEYGGKVVEGSKVTLAHHSGKYANNPAPCSVSMPPLNDGSTILVSHIDADTIGGCLELMGLKPKSDEFWDAVAFVDVNGPHNAYQLSDIQRDMLNALWAWNNTLPRVRYMEVTDVTQNVLDNVDIINRIIAGDIETIEAGKKWEKETTAAVEKCLVKENLKVRTFKTDEVFCSASYYSTSFGVVIPATVALNTKLKSITIAFADGGEKYSAREIVQSLWGSEAGGHAGIAGSPRGWTVSDKELEDEFQKAVLAVEALQ